MKNLKFSFLLLLLVSLFACNTQQIAEDEAPTSIRSSVLVSDDSGPIEEEPEEPLTMKVSVRYFSGTNRNAFRALFSDALGITGWASCSIDLDVEVWIVTDRTFAEFSAIMASIGNYVINEDGSVSNIRTKDPYAGANPGSWSLAPEFYFRNICF